MRNNLAIILALTAACAAPAAAQLALPPLGGAINDTIGNDTIGTVGRVIDPAQATVHTATSRVARLAELRLARLAELARKNPQTIDLDAEGNLARRGELLLMAPTDADLDIARTAGFGVLGRESLDELGISVVRLNAPSGMPLAKAQSALQQLLPATSVVADNLHFPAGYSVGGLARERSLPAAEAIGTSVGIIDGAPGRAVQVETVRGFARGAPHASNHASAIASLLGMAGIRRIAVADVYGTDPAGGNALAISQGLNWLVGQGVRVIAISLVGPDNRLLALAVAAARRRGAMIVAAVGNDGPAAPPAYPASYPGVIAVTAVDGRNRALIEAGRALHLDYAGPGADMRAANAQGKWLKIRGTSYAVPLVAARAAAAMNGESDVIAALDRQALDLGAKGPDSTYGRGLLCSLCRRTR